MKRTDVIITGMVWLLLLAGGLWHVLDVLQAPMRLLAGPMMIALAALLTAREIRARLGDRRAVKRFAIWVGIVFVGGFVAETIGVKTGQVFGSYQYGRVLHPQLFGVPVAIGFAWVLMEISSLAIAQRVLPGLMEKTPTLFVPLIAVLMVVFDVLMEPAAVRLNYWTWAGDVVPWQNYFAWFVLGWLFAWIGARMGVFSRKTHPLGLHVYAAQIAYFILVLL
ncbi:carotenoid biosynthesis protein [bacterium]|nr:carotenoid biosynthesis protein [bacterium]